MDPILEELAVLGEGRSDSISQARVLWREKRSFVDLGNSLQTSDIRLGNKDAPLYETTEKSVLL